MQSKSELKIKISKIKDVAKIPTFGSENAGGADLYACLPESITIEPGKTILVPTGIKTEIPDGYVGLIFARSGLATKSDLAPANKVGVIDSDYRGEWMVALHNHGTMIREVANGERIAQVIFMPIPKVIFEEVQESELDVTKRGEGGFGSTGNK